MFPCVCPCEYYGKQPVSFSYTALALCVLACARVHAGGNLPASCKVRAAELMVESMEIKADLRCWLFESMRSFAFFASLAIVICEGDLDAQLLKSTAVLSVHVCACVCVCVSMGGWPY